MAVRGIAVAQPLREPDLGRILLALGKHGVLPLSLVGYKEPALTSTSTHDQQLCRKFSFEAICGMIGSVAIFIWVHLRYALSL